MLPLLTPERHRGQLRAPFDLDEMGVLPPAATAPIIACPGPFDQAQNLAKIGESSPPPRTNLRDGFEAPG
jgi:hypothetical protein